VYCKARIEGVGYVSNQFETGGSVHINAGEKYDEWMRSSDNAVRSSVPYQTGDSPRFGCHNFSERWSYTGCCERGESDRDWFEFVRL
jgi:hypothetical protein